MFEPARAMPELLFRPDTFFLRRPNFRWCFLARGATPVGQQRIKTEALYTLAAPTAAFSFTRVAWLGLKLSTFTTFYKQV